MADSTSLPARCDVAIVGAGPAGVATALALRRLDPKQDVVLIDAGVRQRPRHHETLVAEAEASLEALGLWKRFLSLGAPRARGTFGAWGGPEPEPRDFLFCRPDRGWRLERQALSRLLLDAARDAGVSIAAATRLTDLAKSRRGWSFEVQAQGRGSTLETRFAVDATGRQAFVSRRLGARKVRFDRLVGAIVVFSTPQDVEIASDAWVETHELGYWYGAARSSTSFMTAFMTDADLAREEALGDDATWHGLFRASALCHRLREARPNGPPSIRAMDSYRLDRMIGDGWLAVGDAAATADCLVSQGLHQAFVSGLRAAAAVLDHLAGRTTGLHRYQRGLEQRFEELLLARKAAYARETRFHAASFWRRRYDPSALDGDQLLSFTESVEARARLDGLGMYLTSDQLHLLCSLCVAPRLVEAVVAAFKAHSKSAWADDEDLGGVRSSEPPDWRILQALRFLVEQGLIVAE